jgi:hypothetical protein
MSLWVLVTKQPCSNWWPMIQPVLIIKVETIFHMQGSAAYPAQGIYGYRLIKVM